MVLERVAIFWMEHISPFLIGGRFWVSCWGFLGALAMESLSVELSGMVRIGGGV